MTANTDKLSYVPEIIAPSTDLYQYVEEEFRKLQYVLAYIQEGRQDELHVAPGKPDEGQVVYADGTDWNPGRGKGLYVYKSGVWTFVA